MLAILCHERSIQKAHSRHPIIMSRNQNIVFLIMGIAGGFLSCMYYTNSKKEYKIHSIEPKSLETLTPVKILNVDMDIMENYMYEIIDEIYSNDKITFQTIMTQGIDGTPIAITEFYEYNISIPFNKNALKDYLRTKDNNNGFLSKLRELWYFILPANLEKIPELKKLLRFYMIKSYSSTNKNITNDENNTLEEDFLNTWLKKYQTSINNRMKKLINLDN